MNRREFLQKTGAVVMGGALASVVGQRDASSALVDSWQGVEFVDSPVMTGDWQYAPKGAYYAVVVDEFAGDEDAAITIGDWPEDGSIESVIQKIDWTEAPLLKEFTQGNKRFELLLKERQKGAIQW